MTDGNRAGSRRQFDSVRNYVDGQWVDVDTQTRAAVVDPATGETLSSVPFSDRQHVESAVAAASDAFEEWRETPPVERVEYLFAFKRELEEHIAELTEILTREHGKTTAEARGEIERGIQNVAVATGIPSLLRDNSGVVEDAAPGIDENATRQPLGVFTAITPFNFPAMIPLWFLPYAIATGNTFVLKPSEKVPLSAVRILELLERTGLPDGVVNLVHGGEETVDALLTHEEIEGVSFVGSTPVAQHVYRTAAEHGKRVQAQGGAKNYAVVTPSANLEQSVPNIIGSVYGNAGERCLATDVVVAVDDVREELTADLLEQTRELTVGNGLEEDTDVGPLITPEHRDRVVSMIDEAIEAGAEPILDGRESEGTTHTDGNYLEPTVLENVTPEMTIAQEEIFGPVLCLMAVDDLDEAIDLVNDTRYGNASSIYTERGSDARKYKREVDAGNIGVNVGVCAPMPFFHFGGRKDSFFGDLHAQGEDAVQFYTEKTIVIRRWFDS